MSEITVLDGQVIADIAVQYLGDAERSIEIAALNGLSISDDLKAGAVLKIPDPDRTKQDIVTLFKNPALAPASNTVSDPKDEGIDFWIIENDFIVQ